MVKKNTSARNNTKKKNDIEDKVSEEKEQVADKKDINNTSKKIIRKNGKRKRRKFKPGTVSLREIRKYQKTTELLTAKARMVRLIRDIAANFVDDAKERFTKQALLALRTASEDYLTDLFKDTGKIAISADHKKGILLRHYKLAVDFENKRRESVKAALH